MRIRHFLLLSEAQFTGMLGVKEMHLRRIRILLARFTCANFFYSLLRLLCSFYFT
ncbi:hypothetical protein HMPREF1144_1555 [Klebsiella sp. OBRC7]|nr:hypothetical protein HMPREF1144_1555 [Klebsiella sp. OBRC7]